MKKMLKRFIFVSLVVCLLVLLIPGIVSALPDPVYEVNIENTPEAFVFENITDPVTKEIIGVKIKSISAEWYKTTAGDLNNTANLIITIPNEINNKKVLSIGDSAFTRYSYFEVNGWPPYYRNYTVISVDFSEMTALEEIGTEAFLHNHLTSISLPNTVTKIGNSAFRYSNLTEITLSENITSIGADAFRNNAITSIRVNGSTTTEAFELPNGIEFIGNSSFRDSFSNNVGDVAFKIPESVTKIDDSAFYNTNISNATITVEGKSPYTNYHLKAFNIKGNNTNTLKAVSIVFPSQADYSSFKEQVKGKAPDYTSSYTYEMDVNFENTQSEDSIPSEKKLYNKSIKYEKNENGIWSLNESYTLPPMVNFPIKDGYGPSWVYEGTITKVVTVDSNITTTATPPDSAGSVKLIPGMSLVDPVVKGTVNGVVVSDGDRSGNRCEFSVEVPNVYSPTNPTVGVEVTHPLLNNYDSFGGTVFIYYRWFDVQGGTSGSRNDYPFNDSSSKLTYSKDININGSYDLRYINDPDNGSNKTNGFYEMMVYGYYYYNNTQTKFYQSSLNFITFWNTGATDDTVFVFYVNEYTPVTITYALNGGNVGGDTSNIVWTDVKTETLGAYDSIPEPVQEGYTLAGWTDSDTSAEITPENMASQAVTVSKIYTAQWTKKSSPGSPGNPGGPGNPEGPENPEGPGNPEGPENPGEPEPPEKPDGGEDDAELLIINLLFMIAIAVFAYRRLEEEKDDRDEMFMD